MTAEARPTDFTSSVVVANYRQKVIASITRQFPFYSGFTRLSCNRVFELLTGPRAPVVWARVPGGYDVAAPLGDYVGKLVFYFGDVDRKVGWACERLVRRGDTVLDIGANIGSVTMMLSSLVGDNGTVHAFEPNPDMCDLIRQAIVRNRVENVHLHQVALGASSGDLSLSIPPDNAGAASLSPARHTGGDKSFVVPVRPLSSFDHIRSISQIRLVKIDVEGFEPEVLAGAADLFRERPPDVVLFELNDSPALSLDKHPTIRLLTELGYGFFRLPQGRLIRMRAVKFEAGSSSYTGRINDFVAARGGDVYDEVARILRAV